MKTKTSNIIEVLLTPVVPVAIGVYFIFSKSGEINIISIMGLVLIVFVFLKLIYLLKHMSESIHNISLLSIDWFLLDFINMISYDQFEYLKPSILESVVKNSLSLII